MKTWKMILLWLIACVAMYMLFGILAMISMIGASFMWLQPAVICYKRGETNGAVLFSVMFVFTCLFGIWLGSLFR